VGGVGSYKDALPSRSMSYYLMPSSSTSMMRFVPRNRLTAQSTLFSHQIQRTIAGMSPRSRSWALTNRLPRICRKVRRDSRLELIIRSESARAFGKDDLSVSHMVRDVITKIHARKSRPPWRGTRGKGKSPFSRRLMIQQTRPV